MLVPYDKLQNIGTLQSGDFVAVFRAPFIEGKATVRTIQNAVQPYLKYCAILNQSGTSAPTISELENLLSTTITASYSAAGEYLLTAADSVFLDPSVTWVMVGPTKDKAENIGWEWIDDKTIKLTSNGNSVIFNVAVEIRVYPYAP